MKILKNEFILVLIRFIKTNILNLDFRYILNLDFRYVLIFGLCFDLWFIFVYKGYRIDKMSSDSNFNSTLGGDARRYNYNFTSPRFTSSVPRPIYDFQIFNRIRNQDRNLNRNQVETFKDIVITGNFHYPANTRYSPDSVVICDRCQKRNLLACIGSGDKDLCLPCADLVIHGKDQIIPNIYRSDKPNYI